ncbi:MAG: hypothetical protein LBN34_03265 [Clostridiales Family XIII bacterium]|jgi:lantibiotic modifying enzyme|nr:hypothetical protein [Clostridiales Family XIII bacterium]
MMKYEEKKMKNKPTNKNELKVFTEPQGYMTFLTKLSSKEGLEKFAEKYPIDLSKTQSRKRVVNSL